MGRERRRSRSKSPPHRSSRRYDHSSRAVEHESKRDHRHCERARKNRQMETTRERSPWRRSPSDARRQQSKDRSEAIESRSKRSRSPQRSSSPASKKAAEKVETEAVSMDTRAEDDNNAIESKQSEIPNISLEDDDDVEPGEIAEKPKEPRQLVAKRTLEQVAKQKAEETGLKPVFLSKKQREELALQRLAERRAEQKRVLEEAERAKKEYTRAVREDSVMKARREREAKRLEKEKEDDEKKDLKAIERDRLQEKQLAAIKETYLGKKKQKKTVIPPSQKFKFSFDWEASDDTTAHDFDPLYQKRASVGFGFGRGFVAGYDRREQLKQNKFWKELAEDPERETIVNDEKYLQKVKERAEKEKEKALLQEKLSRHWTKKTLDEMEERDWRILREEYDITTRGAHVPHPLRFWHEATVCPQLRKNIADCKYEEPSPIQRASLPVGLRNRDVVGIARTGSGKTAAFLIPLIEYITKLPRLRDPDLAMKGPYAVIMAPTRELAQQISDECNRLTAGLDIKNVCIVGGLSIQGQGFFLREGAEVIVATPGRLWECLEKRYLVLAQCNYVVLDEADRMIDLCFEPQIVRVMEAMPSSNLRPDDETTLSSELVYRQTVMFSATMPIQVEQLAKKYLRLPVFIAIGSRSGQSNESIKQIVEFANETAKRARLLYWVEQFEAPIVVFCNSRKTCDFLARLLDENGYCTTTMHSSKSQEQRTTSLAGLKDGRFNILVATDVAGRGIDISGVTLVLNYEMPKEIGKYMHRIGRTGRAGLTGTAVSFLSYNEDNEIVYALRETLLDSGNEVPHELETHPFVHIKPGTGRKPRDSTVFLKM